MICSLTKAAAAEVAGRDLPIPPANIGTLHAQCYQALGNHPIAESKLHIEDWNQRCPAYTLSFGAADRHVDEDNIDPPTGTDGDRFMREYQAHRARLTTDSMPAPVVAFADCWKAWKKHNSLIDFTDMIEIALQDCDQAPTRPDVIFVDEAQDLDHLQMALMRKWGAAAGQLIVVGDPDQNIYRWRGSDPTAFTNPPLPQEFEHVLSQSFRLPKEVHSQAVAWINQAQNRKPIVYRPRNADGQCTYSNANFVQPGPAVDDATKHMADGRSVMFLTSCSYMLDNLITLLRQEGIPFHNPQRRSNGAWNPFPEESQPDHGHRPHPRLPEHERAGILDAQGPESLD